MPVGSVPVTVENWTTSVSKNPCAAIVMISVAISTTAVSDAVKSWPNPKSGATMTAALVLSSIVISAEGIRCEVPFSA